MIVDRDDLSTMTRHKKSTVERKDDDILGRITAGPNGIALVAVKRVRQEVL